MQASRRGYYFRVSRGNVVIIYSSVDSAEAGQPGEKSAEVPLDGESWARGIAGSELPFLGRLTGVCSAETLLIIP